MDQPVHDAVYRSQYPEKNGLINTYLKHSAIKGLNQQQKNFLDYLAAQPWKFSFSLIRNSPSDQFYEMEDVLTGENYILYSPGIADIIRNQSIILWFNLIGFNGECWQSYGPIAAYQSFTPDDIYFFATEMYQLKQMDTGNDIMLTVEENPVPYMMLISGSAYPLTFHKDDLLLQVTGWNDLEPINPDLLEKYFKIEYIKPVFKLTFKRWGSYPHFSSAYYNEKKKVLYLYSMTDRGFEALAKRFNQCGYEISGEPDIRVTVTMLTTAEKILKKKINLNEYENLFEVKPTESDSGEIRKLNKLMDLVIPEINAGRRPDIASMAKKTGVDEHTAREILDSLIMKVDGIGR